MFGYLAMRSLVGVLRPSSLLRIRFHDEVKMVFDSNFGLVHVQPAITTEVHRLQHLEAGNSQGKRFVERQSSMSKSR